MEKIKIAYITKNLRINGISTVLMNYCKSLDKEKFDVTIFAGNPITDKHKKSCEENGIKLVVVPSKGNKKIIKYIFFLLKNISKKKYDIVHVHGNSATIICELLIAKIKGIKIRVSHSHNTTCNHVLFHKLMQPLLNRLSTVKYACGYDAGVWMYGHKNFDILPNGFVVNNFAFNLENRKKNRNLLNVEDKIVIGHVGIFTDQKNHSFILDIFNEIAKQDERYVLLLIGGGPKYNEISEKVNNSKFKDRILLYGETNNVKELYDAMDIFLLPSKYEGLVVVLLEAQVEGLPCIVSDKVSAEGFFNSDVSVVALEKSPYEWANVITNVDLKGESCRYEYLKENAESIKRYDIRSNVKILENRYLLEIKK